MITWIWLDSHRRGQGVPASPLHCSMIVPANPGFQVGKIIPLRWDRSGQVGEPGGPRRPAYLAILSFESELPIWANALLMPEAVVVAKKLPLSAQYLRIADSGSPSVLTWMV